MTEFRSFFFLGVLAFAACTNEGLEYAKSHAELTPAQRQILTTGKIPPGTAVAGLTHDEVKLAMKGFPNTFDKINGEEAWVYVRKKSAPLGMEADEQKSPSARKDMPDAYAGGPVYDVNEKTTVFFQGDRATLAEITQDKL